MPVGRAKSIAALYNNIELNLLSYGGYSKRIVHIVTLSLR